jgi:hypothetical protein
MNKLRKKTIWLIFLGMFLHFQILTTHAREYFVSLKGFDNNPGTVDNPFRTIQKASGQVKPGDTITIRGGTYLLDAQFKPQGGEQGNWVVYRSMPGEKAILDGSEIYVVDGGNKGQLFSRTTQGVVQIEKASYVKFENIGVINSRAAGFIVRGPSTHIILDSCTTDRTYNSGIGLWYADSVKVYNCEVVRANDREYRNAEVPRPGEAPHEAISICGARFFDVAYNHVHNCYKEGIDCKEVSRYGIIHHNYVHDVPRQAYYVDAWFGLLEDIELYENVAHDSAWGFAISVEGKESEVRNIRFHHNVIYNMKAAGVLFGVWGGDGPRSDIHIFNNTFYNCGSPRWFSGGVGSIDILSKNFKDIYIYRNICDKGWDYEMGFSFTPQEVKQAIKKLNFNAEDNLFESAKNRPSRIGQFDFFVFEYLPPNNTMGAPLYKNELTYDLTPEKIPSVKKGSAKWKYPPSPWYGALKPDS